MLLRLLPRLIKLHHRAVPRTPFRILHTIMTTRAQDLRISLSEEEKKLFCLLVDCASWIDDHPAEVDQLRVKDEEGEWVGELRGDGLVELRIAGGWVRDKLLGHASDDIDVTISPGPLTGLKFATLLERYLESIGRPDLMGKLTKIEAKPEQSKHLETATANVGSLSVDFVQQRGNETYDNSSRIPNGVSFGSPLDDALRRDLTINALFYNLRTEVIEDQTNQGLADLGLLPGSTPTIRTPMPPFETFRDDPLRVVRAVRFAARFGREFVLDRELIKAVGREEIRDSLRDGKKISRERVGVELDKMLGGKDPLLAMELIEQLNLHSLIFLYDPSIAFLPPAPSPPALSHPAPPPHSLLSITASRTLSTLLTSPPTPLHPLLLSALSPTTKKRLYLCCGLLPLYDFMTIEKKRTIWLGEKVVKEGIKWASADWTWATKAREASALLAEVVRKFAGMREADRAELGLMLRSLCVHDMPPLTPNTRWESSLLWSLVVDATKVAGDSERTSDLITLYNHFVERVVALELDKHAFDPPILDGTTVLSLLPAIKSSPAATVHVLQLVVQFQLGHPDATKEDCRVFLEGEGAVAVTELLEAHKKKEHVKKGVKRKEPK